LAELPYTTRVAPNADYMSPSGMPSHNVKVGQQFFTLEMTILS